eukprot:g2655.t1
MTDRLWQYVNLMVRTNPPSSDTDGTVFSGEGGRALVLLKLHELTRNDTLLELAQEYVKSMESRIWSQEMKDNVTGFVGFMWSRAGMLCVSALAAQQRGDQDIVRRRIDSIRKMFDKKASYDDFDSGRAGLIYAARFLEANIMPRGIPKIDTSILNAAAQAIVQRGSDTGRENGNEYLQWHGPNDAGLWLGQSHGSAGVLQQLIEGVPEFLRENKTAAGLVRRTLDHMLSVQFDDGNFPSEYYNASQNVLVQWDHGAPGISAALVAASIFFNESRYLDAANRALDCTWKRGLLTKGLMNCHGISGNTWMQLYAAQMTQNLTFAYRALAFQDIVVRTPLLSDPNKMRQPQPEPKTPWMFWVGSYESSIELWADLLFRGPMNVSETGFMPRL